MWIKCVSTFAKDFDNFVYLMVWNVLSLKSVCVWSLYTCSYTRKKLTSVISNQSDFVLKKMLYVTTNIERKKISLKFEAFKCVILKLSWIKYFRIGDVDSHFISKKICIIDWLRYIKCPISLSLAGWKQSCSGEHGKLPKQSSIGSKTATAKRRAKWNCIRFNQYKKSNSCELKQNTMRRRFLVPELCS